MSHLTRLVISVAAEIIFCAKIYIFFRKVVVLTIYFFRKNVFQCSTIQNFFCGHKNYKL